MKAAIIQAVRDQPGIHFRELQRKADCSVHTLDYHIRRTPELQDRKICGYRRIFPREVPEDLQESLAALNHERRGEILREIYDNPGITSTELATALDLPTSSVSEHISRMQDHGVIKAEKDGRSKHYSPSRDAKQAIVRFGQRLLDDTTEGFIEMWE